MNDCSVERANLRLNTAEVVRRRALRDSLKLGRSVEADQLE